MKQFPIIRLKPLSILPAIAMMCLIFGFSAQNGKTSSGLSYKVSSHMVTIADKLLDKNLTEDQIEYYTDTITLPVRKLAHMSEYFLLAITVAFPLYVYRLRGLPLLFLSGAICVGFAALDEFHQFFVSGRSASVRDVMIDSVGIFLGIMVVHIFCRMFSPHRTNV